MRKADYVALATIIAKHRREALRALQEANDDAMRYAASVRIQTCADVARDFARFAAVDAHKFLTACAIEP